MATQQDVFAAKAAVTAAEAALASATAARDAAATALDQARTNYFLTTQRFQNAQNSTSGKDL